MRYVVVVYRFDDDYTQVIVGPFRTKERAEERAGVYERLAAKYEDPEGALGDDNVLGVSVEPIEPGSASADSVLSILYSS
jgi:hypothetical protein